jgi:hypothetical protein
MQRLTHHSFGNIFPIMKDANTIILLALARLLRPIVRMLLRNKVSYKTFEETARQVFVEVADQHFAVPGRKQTNSRISVVTGLSRKEVLRIKRLAPLEDRDLADQFHRAARVVSAWTTEPDFMDAQENPISLPFDGPMNSFAALVERYSGDVPARAMLDELISAGVVAMNEQRHVTLKRRSYVPSGDDTQMLKILGTDVGDLANTIVHNFDATTTQSRFQLKVAYDNLPEECLATFHQQVSERGHDVLVEFDKYLRLQDRDTNPSVKGRGRMRAGVGIYYFQEKQEEAL